MGMWAVRCQPPLLIIPTIAIPTGSWASTPTACPASTANTSAATASSSPAVAWAALAPRVGGRAYESKVDVDGLVEQFGVVGTIDSGAGLVKGRVFD